MAATLAHMPSRPSTGKPALAANAQVEKLFYRRQEAAYALGLPLRSHIVDKYGGPTRT
jgi:hypothetical protein